MKYTECLEVLEAWYDYHHGQCDDTTCAMAECEVQGLMVYGPKLLADAIGMDRANSWDENINTKAFDADKLLNTKYKKRYEKDIDKEWNELMKVDHMECECGAIIWQPDMCCNMCSSCGNESNKESKR